MGVSIGKPTPAGFLPVLSTVSVCVSVSERYIKRECGKERCTQLYNQKRARNTKLQIFNVVLTILVSLLNSGRTNIAHIKYI